MLLTVTPLEDPGPPSPTPPPPTAPKPSKDNARLQRLLRKAAKRSGVQQTPTQPPKSFRSTLSPVSEGDLENLEPASPRKKVSPPLILPPRFQIKAVTHRIPSPYPKQRSFTFTVVEQQSLNQYLNSPPPRDSPSPRFPRPTTPVVFQAVSNTSTVTLQVGRDDTGQSSTEPCTLEPICPDKATLSRSPISHDLVTTNGTLSAPGHKTTEESRNNSQIDTVFTNKERGSCTSRSAGTEPDKPKSILRQSTAPEAPKNFQEAPKSSTNKPSVCCSPTLEITIQAVTTTPLAAETNVSLLPPSGVAVIPDITISPDPGLTHMTNYDKMSRLTDLPKEPRPAPSGNALKSLPTIVPKASPPSEKQSTTEEINLLKNPERAKPPKRKPGGGWARLVKHLVVEPDEPSFPETERTETKDEPASGDTETVTDGQQQIKIKSSRANKMWDALLYHMATSPKVQEKTGPGSEASAPPPALPFLRSRLPLLLHRPRFDARKLKEIASRPLRRVTAFFHRKTGEKPSSAFNRTASGWSIRVEDAEKS